MRSIVLNLYPAFYCLKFVSYTNEIQKSMPVNTEIYPVTKLLGRSANVTPPTSYPAHLDCKNAGTSVADPHPDP
jgi:hypothetical protein